MNRLARVIEDYEAPYSDPIKVRAGDEIAIDHSRETDLEGWLWCTSRAGKSGWVPEAYIDQQGASGCVRCDYDAIELTVRVGDKLVLHKEESGFFWATDEAGRNGWVPSTHLVIT